MTETIETDWLKKWAMFSPRNIAVQDADSGIKYSYARLYFLSCILAKKLASDFQVTAGDRVAVLATNELEFLPLFFAVQRLGAILVPVNFRLTAREVTHILGDCEAKVLIHQNQFNSVLHDVDASAMPKQRWAFEDTNGLVAFLSAQMETDLGESLGANVLKLRPLAWEYPPPRPDGASGARGKFEDPCMILYTSGTTGAPKGAIITQKMIYWNSINTTLRLNLNQSDVQISFLPLFHTGGWNVLLTPFLHRGARTILIKKFEADRILELAEQEGATILFGVPTTMDMMARSKHFDSCNLKKVRYAIVGGEPMPLELIKLWQEKGIPIRQGFGMTEFGPNVFSLNEEDSIRKIGSIGFPNFYIDVRVLDQRGHDITTPDEIGEMVLRGPVCSPGYWRHPEATAKSIVDGWFYTGDLVRRDADGYFYVAGRKKEMFISGGENVYPVEIEHYLNSHPKIREVAVIGVSDVKWGEVGKAFVVLNPGEQMTADEVLSFAQQGLAKFKIPKHVQFLAEIPKGDSGKILKRKLADLS